MVRRQEEEMHRVVGREIRRLRKAHKRTLAQMARRTGLSVSLLSQIERAECSASVATLLKVARALDVRLCDLFGDF
jgi:transcriptional regulator with XRE-family HTH domain